MLLFFLIKILIVGNTLAYNPTLKDVAYNRQNLPVKYEIDKGTDVEDYQCLLGVPYGYGRLIGKEVYFFEHESKKFYKMLVVDVEQKKHFPHMRDNDLIADTNCKFLVHKRGDLFLVEKTRRSLQGNY